MSAGYLFVALAYLVFAAVAVAFESWRTRRSGPDAITMFLAVFLLQACFAGIAIYAILPFVDPAAPTGNEVFDRILQAGDPGTALLVLCLTVWFLVFFYLSCGIGGLALRYLAEARDGRPLSEIRAREGRLFLLLAAGMMVTLWSFWLLGDSLLGRYTNLILYRSQVPEIERTALNANAFALTQTWAWLSVLAVFVAFERQRPAWVKALWLAVTAGFALLGVSRRALFLPLLLGYLTVVLYRGRWRLRWIVAGLVPMVMLLAFGKDLLSSLAFTGSIETAGGSYQSWGSALLRAAGELGITVVESVGTLTLVHTHPRLGVDHLLSIAQRFPEGMLGLDIDWPERMVRISTEAFADSYAQDIPPGLPGQMWLDFGVAGPVVWGAVLGFQMSVVQFLYRRSRRGLTAAAVFVLLAFVVALPVNTGSFDFSFSVDIFVLLAALWWCLRVSGPPGPAGATVRAAGP